MDIRTNSVFTDTTLTALYKRRGNLLRDTNDVFK